MIIPAKVTVDMMYRDACNYKICDTIEFSNKSKLSKRKIENALNKLMKEDSIVPGYYGITRHPAPVDNEFMPASEYDHPFVEICDFDFDDVNPAPKGSDDIVLVVEAVSKPALVKARIKDAKQ